MIPTKSATAKFVQYPRTPHFYWSKSRTPDDIVINRHNFNNEEVIVSEKMDGENTTIYSDGSCHPRKINQGVASKEIHRIAEEISPLLDDNWRVCGEDMTAVKTIEYTNPPSLFIHSLWNGDVMADYDTTEKFVRRLDYNKVRLTPLLYQGVWNELEVRKAWDVAGDYGPSEGFVVRVKGKIHFNEFNDKVAKFVNRRFSPEVSA